MGAPLGNEFWKQRTKHGRDKLFADPQALWEAASEYFKWCDENPFIEIDFRGKDLDQVRLPKMRPYTWQGLELYLNINSFEEYKTNPNYKDFSEIITHIGKVIYNQKFSGAASGFFNANIISRDLGLQDKQSLEHSGNVLLEKRKITFK